MTITLGTGAPVAERTTPFNWPALCKREVATISKMITRLAFYHRFHGFGRKNLWYIVRRCGDECSSSRVCSRPSTPTRNKHLRCSSVKPIQLEPSRSEERRVGKEC